MKEPVGLALAMDATYHSILRAPDLVRAFDAEDKPIKLDSSGNGIWAGSGVEVRIDVHDGHASLLLRSPGTVTRIQVRWRGDFRAIKRYLGDHWERSYADMEWRGEVPGRTMPWYFMACDGHRTHGYGLRTSPKAFCFWNADCEGISLWADVRNGGLPVELGDRTLEVAEIVCRPGKEGESPFAATRAFCTQMCPHPRLPSAPVYGTNDWNYAYGNNSAELIAGVSALVAELSKNHENRPFSVIDEGWAEGPFNGHFGHGPWFGNPRFGDMGAFASRLRGMGVRPGIWFRPLTPLPDTPDSWRSKRDAQYLDPTIPEVHEHVASHMRRFVDWGYEMVKHDFTTFDILGKWGFEMGPSPTRGGWHFRDTSKTTAEIVTELYQTIRLSAGEAKLIGCNTVSHLATGFHEVQRIGDDTSGRSWNRNRRMGVNTLAFRAAQHRTFYEADPDIVAITQAIPWHLVEQWLRLVSESGSALFVAVDPSIIEPKHRVALERAFDIASRTQTVGEPLDWLDTDCPRQWKLLGKSTEFAWMGEDGAWPFGD
ncbi:MAG: hypothetical protein P4L46_21965 [Fimbriimonas sp.]|nr:hypothetical protein [Fimbriimonas sp.]